jgi:hypothetical protein
MPSEESGLDGVALAVCFPSEASFPEAVRRNDHVRVDVVTAAHEVLHLFGATDKYGLPLRSFEAGTVTRNEIMRLSEDHLSRLRVDAWTAYELGWVKSPRAQNTAAGATLGGLRRPR